MVAQDIKLTAQIQGIDEHAAKLRSFTPKRQRKFLRSAFRAATAPIKTRLRQLIRARILRFGNLARSITTKLKSYASGFLFLIVGAKHRRLGDGTNPGNYFHLADGGTRPHDIETPVLRINGLIVRVEERYTIQHPGSEPNDVRADAYRQTVRKTGPAFARRIEKLIRKAVTQ